MFGVRNEVTAGNGWVAGVDRTARKGEGMLGRNQGWVNLFAINRGINFSRSNLLSLFFEYFSFKPNFFDILMVRSLLMRDRLMTIVGIEFESAD